MNPPVFIALIPHSHCKNCGSGYPSVPPHLAARISGRSLGSGLFFLAASDLENTFARYPPGGQPRSSLRPPAPIDPLLKPVVLLGAEVPRTVATISASTRIACPAW